MTTKYTYNNGYTLTLSPTGKRDNDGKAIARYTLVAGNCTIAGTDLHVSPMSRVESLDAAASCLALLSHTLQHDDDDNPIAWADNPYRAVDFDAIDQWVTDLTERDVIARVNRQHRKADTSHLWPINGRFSVVERAIKQARTLRATGCLDVSTDWQYSAILDDLESTIVNDSRNW